MTVAPIFREIAAQSAADPGQGVAWTQRLFDAIDGRDWPALEAMLDPDVVYERPGYDPLIGVKDVMHFYRDVRIIVSGRHHLQGVLKGAEVLNYHGHFTGTSRWGDPLDVAFCDVCRLNGELLRHRRTFFYVPAV